MFSKSGSRIPTLHVGDILILALSMTYGKIVGNFRGKMDAHLHAEQYALYSSFIYKSSGIVLIFRVLQNEFYSVQDPFALKIFFRSMNCH